MNCKKYRVKKLVNRNGVIYYIAQRKVLGLFWVPFSYEHDRETEKTIPKAYWKQDEAVHVLKDHIRIEAERAAAYKAAKEKIKGNEYICVE